MGWIMNQNINEQYKSIIESLEDRADFEQEGDRLFLNHNDPEARILWAFHRPGGSHPDQIRDADPLVSAMAFNNSLLGALERFRLLHPDVLKDPILLKKISNKSRMLFRSLVDEDFRELVEVLNEFPMFLSLAIHQLIHGRKWKEDRADPIAASRFLKLAESEMNDQAYEGLASRLPAVPDGDLKHLTEWIDDLIQIKPELHPWIRSTFQEQIHKELERRNLHTLQKLAIEKKLKPLNDPEGGFV